MVKQNVLYTKFYQDLVWITNTEITMNREFDSWGSFKENRINKETSANNQKETV